MTYMPQLTDPILPKKAKVNDQTIGRLCCGMGRGVSILFSNDGCASVILEGPRHDLARARGVFIDEKK